MADTFVELQNNPEAAEMPHADWLGLLVDREVTARDNRRLTRRLTSAKLRQVATIENVDYRTARGLDRSLFQNLGTCQWIRDSNHMVIVGPTSTGKSRLACALGNKACRDGLSVLYKRSSRLFADLAQARGEGRLARLIAALERVNHLAMAAAAMWKSALSRHRSSLSLLPMQHAIVSLSKRPCSIVKIEGGDGASFFHPILEREYLRNKCLHTLLGEIREDVVIDFLLPN